MPSLATYRWRRTLRSNQNVVISRRNYGGDFTGLVELLRSQPTTTQPRRQPRDLRAELLTDAAELIGATYKAGSASVARSSLRLYLEIAVDATGTIKVHLYSDEIRFARWLAMLDGGPGPQPAVAIADSREGTPPRWYYGFEWRGMLDRRYAAERANVHAFVTFLRDVARQHGAFFV